jgi:hypothetical protein
MNPPRERILLHRYGRQQLGEAARERSGFGPKNVGVAQIHDGFASSVI